MAETTFRAPVRSSGRGGGGHLVDVPTEVVEALGGQGGGRGRIPVTATFDGVPYRGSIVRMRGGAVPGVQKAIMAEAGVSVGDTLAIVVRNDDAPREVGARRLSEALRRNEAARAAFEGSRSRTGARRQLDYGGEAARDPGAARRKDDPGAARTDGG